MIILQQDEDNLMFNSIELPEYTSPGYRGIQWRGDNITEFEAVGLLQICMIDLVTNHLTVYINGKENDETLVLKVGDWLAIPLSGSTAYNVITAESITVAELQLIAASLKELGTAVEKLPTVYILPEEDK